MDCLVVHVSDVTPRIGKTPADMKASCLPQRPAAPQVQDPPRVDHHALGCCLFQRKTKDAPGGRAA